MQVKKVTSVPLITQDPYMSVWSSADTLYGDDTRHWCKAPQRMYGYLRIDGKSYCFMGRKGRHLEIPQISLDITATKTAYVFENEKVKLQISFISPLLLNEPVLVSRPCTYIETVVESKTGTEVELEIGISSDFVKSSDGTIVGDEFCYQDGSEKFKYVYMAKANQHPLGESGDNITIDWGEVYLASQTGQVRYDKQQECLWGSISTTGKTADTFILAFDDILSINYFGDSKRGYWTTAYDTIIAAIEASFSDRLAVQEKARLLDEELEAEAIKIAGEDYALLCNLSYRHSICAHKLIADNDGELIFLSKENDSNGCIGTVDVSYPSIPLYLRYNAEFVKGMLRPVFKFAKLPVWEYDFAPHDVGRYPYATGQVYGLNGDKEMARECRKQKSIFPFYYKFPSGSDIYDLRYQMPVEECGNMLIMTAVVCCLDKSADFAAPHLGLLEQWVNYLLQYGDDPGEQLCTDDFAGHLAHNVNLAAKAISGIESYAQILRLLGDEAGYEIYHGKAKEMAKGWEERAKDEAGHYRLTFEKAGSFSLKYNTIWDIFYQSELFRAEMFEAEIEKYIAENNEFGVPLDSRSDYTKSDWILWSAVMTDDREKRMKLIAPVAHYARNSTMRVPFSDWYDTVSGEYCNFIARSVQGGIFMPLFMSGC